ncbi:hypothetical protein D3C86_1886290 [compost metagenome]
MIRPNKPNNPDKIMMGNRSILKAMLAGYCGIINEEIPVMATTITIGAETSPAWIAAWPITSAPTILTAEPTCLGSRTPASRNASKVTSIIRASSSAGNGISSLDLATRSSRVVGTIS